MCLLFEFSVFRKYLSSNSNSKTALVCLVILFVHNTCNGFDVRHIITDIRLKMESQENGRKKRGCGCGCGCLKKISNFITSSMENFFYR